MSIKLRVALITLVTFVSLGNVRGQDSELQYWRPVEPFRIAVDNNDPEIRTLLERWEGIGAELPGARSDFAGTYLKAGYRGWILRWAPSAGFVYVYHSEGLSIIDFAYGKVEVRPDEIRFIPERDLRRTVRGIKLELPLIWIPTHSKEVRYMVPGNSIEDFGKYVAGLGDYNDFNGPCCEFDPFFESSVTRREPSSNISAIFVPATYQRFIKRPITGHIVSVGKRRIVKNYGLRGELYSHLFGESSLTSIVIDVGRVHGLRKNMLLRIAGDQFNLPRQFVRVASVGKRTAVAVVIREVDESHNETYPVGSLESNKRISFPPIRPGMLVTTSPILNK